jgi:hypothetical protein
MIVEQKDGTISNLDVVTKTDNDLNNIKFVWLLTDINNDYLNNGIIDGITDVDSYEYVCNILELTPQIIE